ncbi:MAG: hypothetical protein IJM51_03700 [Clostridia bacterium]|nr:hypothetical protein [Clostridia bacterium]
MITAASDMIRNTIKCIITINHTTNEKYAGTTAAVNIPNERKIMIVFLIFGKKYVTAL